MDFSSSKENILRKIRKALQKTVPLPFPVVEKLNKRPFPEPDEDLSVLFGQQFTGLGGKFAYCMNELECVEQVTALIRARQWKEVYCVEEPIRKIFLEKGFADFSTGTLADSDLSITSCEALVARTGSMVLSSAVREGRTASVYAPVHICLVKTSQLVFDIKDAFVILQKKYNGNLPSLISFATGPSRTADIEKTLVVGVHGPKEVYCFLIEDGSG